MQLQNKFLRNLQIGFGVSLLILIATAVVSYYSIYNLKEQAGLGQSYQYGVATIGNCNIAA